MEFYIAAATAAGLVIFLMGITSINRCTIALTRVHGGAKVGMRCAAE